MSPKKIIPLIMCGGTGTRLWPLSRKAYPKQFLNILSHKNNSLLQETVLRISSISNIQNPIIICNEEHRFIVAEQLREIGVIPQAIILEPLGKNTAPAATLGAIKSMEIDKESILLVLSSDHEIKNTNKFCEVIKSSIFKAEEGKLITYGIIPSCPETGYGYIETYDDLNFEEIKGSPIKSFYEKPDIEKAKEFITRKSFSWNSGIFLFKAVTLIEELEKYCPDIYLICKETILENNKDLDFQRVDKSVFEKCPNISLDKAVMEKTDKGFVFPLDTGWNDLGDWKSVWNSSKKDNDGNVSLGKVFLEETKNCYLRSEKSMLTCLGLRDLIIVETGDAILIADKNKTQNVKLLVQNLYKEGFKESIQHQKIYRPWGFYISIVEGLRWQVKLITVKPGASLSLQMHHHRSEHWVVVKGTAKIEIDDRKILLNENQSTYIPVCSKHRLSNPGKIPLELIEVQSGPYLGEDDIKRFEDTYDRIN